MIYIFGYGSLINIKTIAELDKTQKRTTCPVNISNLQRSWCVHGKSQTYLGIKDTCKFSCNGLLLSVSPTELYDLCNREEFYTLKEIDKSRIKFVYGKTINLDNDKIYSFYSITTNEPDETHPILNKYLYKCLIVCMQISKHFYNVFLQTTYRYK